MDSIKSNLFFWLVGILIAIMMSINSFFFYDLSNKVSLLSFKHWEQRQHEHNEKILSQIQVISLQVTENKIRISQLRN